MKVSLTKKELLELLTKHFGYEVTECVIAKSFVLYNKLNSAMKKEISTPNNKIASIKLLRTLVHHHTKNDVGLADAKWAVENWPKWIAFVKINNRIPTIKTDYTHSAFPQATLS